MVDSDNTDRIAETSERFQISVGTAHKIVHEGLVFSKVSYRWVLAGQCKALYLSKKSGNHLSVWLGTAATPTLKSKSGRLWSLIVFLSQKFCKEQIFQARMK